MFDLKPSHYVHINVPGDGLAVVDALDIEVVLLLVEEGKMVVVDVLLVTVVGDSVVVVPLLLVLEAVIVDVVLNAELY